MRGQPGPAEPARTGFAAEGAATSQRANKRVRFGITTQVKATTINTLTTRVRTGSGHVHYGAEHPENQGYQCIGAGPGEKRRLVPRRGNSRFRGCFGGGRHRVLLTVASATGPVWRWA